MNYSKPVGLMAALMMSHFCQNLQASQAPKVLVVLGSARTNSVSEKIARNMLPLAPAGSLDLEIVDLRQYPLAVVDLESKKSPESAAQNLINKARGADAIIFLAPNYNGGYSGILINAIDIMGSALTDKVVGLIGYSGGPDGGQEALDALMPVLKTLNANTSIKPVTIKFADNVFNDSGNFKKQDIQDAIQQLLETLAQTLQK